MEKDKFNYFNEIEQPLLRVWNITVTAYNLKDDFGEGVFVEYVTQLSPKEKMQVMLILHGIQQHGVEAMKKQIMSATTFPEEDV